MKKSTIVKAGVVLSATTLGCLAIRGHRKIARCKARCDAEVAKSKEACDAYVARHNAEIDHKCEAVEGIFNSLTDEELDYIAENLSDEELLSLIIQIMSELDNTSKSFNSAI